MNGNFFDDFNDIYVFDELDSTNEYAKELTAKGAPHGTVVMARRQSAGKGRLGRSFYSPEGGLYMSVIIRPDFDMSKVGLVTTAAAVAVAEAIDEVALKEADRDDSGCSATREALIKWVNDVYVDGKKVCGILAEGVSTSHKKTSDDAASGNLDAIILGIGINTSTEGFPEELIEIAGAVTGDYSKDALAASIISKVLGYIDEISGSSTAASSIGSPDFLKTYKKKSLVLGKTISVYKGSYKISPEDELPSRPARALDIDDNGGLVVLYSDGSRETLVSGEVSIRQ